MSNKTHNPPPATISLGDVYFVIFRHKWKILIFSAAGFLTAVALYLFFPQAYQSEADLYVRYVEEGKPLSSPGNDENAMSPDGRGDSIMQTEVRILESADVMAAAVKDVGAAKILAKAGGGDDTNKAARLIEKNLTIEAAPVASVIEITFRYPDQKIVQPVLSAIVDNYFKKHEQMHRGGVVFNDFLVQETNRLCTELTQTETALQQAKDKAGVISVDDATKGYEQQISQIGEELFTAQAELAEHEGILKETTGESASAQQIKSTPKASNPEAKISPAIIEQYKNVCMRLGLLKKMEDGFLLQGYTEENVLVSGVREQIVQKEEIKKKLEQEEPRLTELAVTLSTTADQSEHSLFNATDESAQIVALNAKIKVLNSQMAQVKTQSVALNSMAATISELEQKKQSEDANLEYFSRALAQSRIDAMLGNGNAPIGIMQLPSPPVRERPKFLKKVVLAVAFAGFAGGLALAFFIELFWDRSVKRPADIETKLRLPLFITIPDITKNGHRHLLTAASPRLLKGPDDKAAPEEAVVATWNRSHPLRRFCEGLRNRLVVYFEVNKLAHNPKLVAVTSCGKGAGVSSVAAGLAATLSETGVGNVLLVDMNVEGGSAQQFRKGKLACGVDDVLEVEKRESALVQEHLYVAAEPVDEDDKLPRVLPKRFAGLIPRLKASDFDYVIFDMPPVNQISLTARLSGLMDQVLLVIESEKTNQDVVKRVVSLLGESNAKVSTVLNKVNKYVPSRLNHEFLDDI